MKTQAYAIYDTASGVYMNVIFARADGEITRTFQELTMNAEHPVGAHPEDYTLFKLGTFNDNTGILTGHAPVKLATGLEMVALSRNVNRDNVEALDLKIAEDAQLSPGGTA